MNPILWDLCYLKIEPTGCQRCDKSIQGRLLELRRRGYGITEMSTAEYKKNIDLLEPHERWQDGHLDFYGVENVFIPKGEQEKIVIRRGLNPHTFGSPR